MHWQIQKVLKVALFCGAGMLQEELVPFKDGLKRKEHFLKILKQHLKTFARKLNLKQL